MSFTKKLRLLPILLLCTAGCIDDYPTIARDSLAQESENVDRIMKVVDEETAKEYDDYKLSSAPKREVIGKRFDRWRNDLDKKPREAFDKYSTMQQKIVADDRAPDPEEFKEFPLSVHFYRVTRELVFIERTKKREGTRLSKVIADLIERKINELREQGEANPIVNPAQEWPTLSGLASALTGKSK